MGKVGEMPPEAGAAGVAGAGGAVDGILPDVGLSISRDLPRATRVIAAAQMWVGPVHYVSTVQYSIILLLYNGAVRSSDMYSAATDSRFGRCVGCLLV